MIVIGSQSLNIGFHSLHGNLQGSRASRRNESGRAEHSKFETVRLIPKQISTIAMASTGPTFGSRVASGRHNP